MNFRRLIKDKAREIKLWRAFVEGRHSFDMEMKRPILYYEQLDNRRDYDFLDNQKKKENLCIVLAGYKEKLWKDVFERLKAYMPDNTDVCICSSGKKVDKLESVCKREHWSYLATKRNQVCDIQNLAILLHQKAKFIYKIDEDIFLTRYFFTNLKKRLIINPPPSL